MSHYDYAKGETVITSRQEDEQEARELLLEELDNNDWDFNAVYDQVFELADGQTSPYYGVCEEIWSQRSDVREYEEDAKDLSCGTDKSISDMIQTTIFCYWNSILHEILRILEQECEDGEIGPDKEEEE